MIFLSSEEVYQQHHVILVTLNAFLSVCILKNGFGKCPGDQNFSQESWAVTHVANFSKVDHSFSTMQHRIIHNVESLMHVLTGDDIIVCLTVVKRWCQTMEKYAATSYSSSIFEKVSDWMRMSSGWVFAHRQKSVWCGWTKYTEWLSVINKEERKIMTHDAQIGLAITLVLLLFAST